MDRRRTQSTTAQRVSAAIARAGVDVPSVSKATGIPLIDLSDRLNGNQEFTVNELGDVGGFLRVHPADLIGAAA